MNAATAELPTPVPTFGDTIRKMRVAKGWSQDRAAAVFGCLRNQISDYEREMRRPNLGRVRAMAREYGDTCGYLEALHDGRAELALARQEIERLRVENARLWSLVETLAGRAPA